MRSVPIFGLLIGLMAFGGDIITNALKVNTIILPQPDCSQCVIGCSADKCPCVFPGTSELIYPRQTPVPVTVTPANCQYCPQPLCKCGFDVCTPDVIRQWIG